jgi:hypothetical protein
MNNQNDNALAPLAGGEIVGFRPASGQRRVRRMSLSIHNHTTPLQVMRERARRYELTLQAISKCTLTGVDFGDWVQAACEDALAGRWPECYQCGTAVHDGPCVSGGDSPPGPQTERKSTGPQATAPQG